MSIHCPLCNKEAHFLLETMDYNRKVTEETFTYGRCPACELIFLSEVPENLGDYYAEEYYEIPSPGKLEKTARSEQYRIEIVQKFVTSGRLLEVGPAFGIFALQAKQAGFDVDTVEMDARCCEYLAGMVGVNAIQSNNPHDVISSMAPHNVIALWHTLEHLPNPWACLDKAAKNLLSGGILLIATPNPRAFQFRLLGPAWPHVDAPRHLYLIPASLLIKVLRPLGLEPVMLTTNDRGGRSWNRFGWQRYMMNIFANKMARIGAFILGYMLSYPMAIWDRRNLSGCAYTIVFRKTGCCLERPNKAL
jgi:2-polyprenyl-3-methyl-5-hydroxy-6-metoxy-1,4-benzoquinol methylase